MESYETQGCYGSGNTPCTVLVYGNWYCVEGSVTVNNAGFELDYLEIGGDCFVNVENIQDIDCFTWNEPINSLDELEEAVKL